jgi:cytochrome c oxidase cbb3-type subunit 3
MKNKRFLIYLWSILFVFLAAIEAQAQGTTTASNEVTMLNWLFNNMFLLLGLIVFFAGCFSIFYVFDKIVKAEELALLAEKGLLTVDSNAKLQTESFWERFNKKAWNIVPVEKEKDIILAHAHDGIYELDNDLPPWWLALFYGGVVFAFVFIGYTHFSSYGQTNVEEYEASIKAAEIQIAKHLSGQANLVDESNVTMLEDKGGISQGAKIYKERCVACHGALGEGGIGPNMTDEYWLHGGGIKDVFKTVKYGVSGKGMQAWKDDLTASQMHQVSSFILTLQGTNPPNGKEKQGDLYEAPEETEETEE